MADREAEEKTIGDGNVAEVGSTLPEEPPRTEGAAGTLSSGGEATGHERTVAYSSLAGARGSSDRPTPVVAGYEILGELGRGAVGVVYHARQVRLNRPCALKMILAGEHTGSEAALRFLVEAESVARLQHPNVIQIHNLGESGGLPYFELEFAPGGSLDKQLDGTPWAPRAAGTTVEALARGVAEAHRLGIVHRDLKPSNILLGADGTPKVADFGLAKSVGADSGLTGTEAVMGTPSYMAPEQAEGKTRGVGPPADVYALGAILYELVTGRPPHRGTTVLETLALVRATEPVAPSRLAPGLPRDLETIALKCLEKAPSRRYESAAELADDLGRWLGGEPIAARASTPVERAWKLARRRPWQASMVALALTFVSTMLGFWAWSYARIGEALDVARVDRRRAEEARSESDRWAVESSRLAFESRRLASSEAAARAESTRRLAALALDKGVLLAESGRVGRGLLWMARAYESANGLDEPLRRSSRLGLADWGREVARPREIADLGVIAINFDSRGDRGLLALGGHSRPYVLDSTTLGQPASFPADMLWYVTAALGGDGRRLVATDSAFVRAWDLPSGTPIGRFPKLRSNIHPGYLAIDPAGRRVAFIDNLYGTLWVWDPTEKGPEARAAAPVVGYLGVAFSPDGRLVASVGEDRKARVWDAGTLALVREFPPRAEPSRLEFLPAGSGVFIWGTDDDPTVAAWGLDADRPRFERTIGARITGLTLRSDGGAVLIGDRDGSIRLLDTSTGEPLAPVIHAGTPVSFSKPLETSRDQMGVRSTVALSPDGQTILSTHADSSARTWDVPTGRQVGSVLEHAGGLVGAGFGADGRTALTATGGGRVVLWDLADGQLGRPMAHRAGLGFNKGEVSPDGRTLLAWGLKPYALLVDVATGMARCAPLVHGDSLIRAARFSPDGSLVATGGDDRFVRLWDADGRPVGRPLSCGHWATCLAFSPDGRTLAAIDALHQLRAWDVATGRPLGPAMTDDGPLYEYFLLFAPDGRTLVTRTMSDQVLRWEVPALRRVGEPLRAIAPSDLDTTNSTMEFSGVRPVGCAPDGATLWLAESGKRPGPSVVRRRDLATWRPIGSPIGREVDSAILSPDGLRLLTRSGTTVRQYRSADGAPVGSALEHPSPVLAMAFNPDGSTIATGAEDGGLRFWDAATGRPVGPPRAHSGPVADLKFMVDGGRVATFVDVPTLWDVPRPLADDPARIATEVRAASQMELVDGDGTHRLALDVWRRARDGLGSTGDPERLPTAEWHARLAARFALRGRPTAALWHLDRLLADRPDEVPALLRRAGVRADLGDIAGAAVDESKVATLAPGLLLAWRACRAGDRLRAARPDRRASESLADLDVLVAARPEDDHFRRLRYRLRLRDGRRAGAASDLRELLRSRPNVGYSTEEFYHLALLSLELGDLAGYRQSGAMMLSLLPPKPSPRLANAAVWTLALGDGGDAVDKDRAVRVIEAAIESLPPQQKQLTINTLGAALYRAGRYEQAARRLADSVRMGGGRGLPQDWAFLALTHHRLGDGQEAATWLARLQAWKPAGLPQSYWEDLEVEILRREAIAVLLLDPAFPADPFRRD